MADFLEEALSGRHHPLTGDTVTLGREVGCEIVVDESSVSRRHCTFQRDGAGWTVRDNASRNGTEVQGKRLLPNEPVALLPNLRFHVGSMELILRTGLPAAAVDGARAAAAGPAQKPSLMAQAQASTGKVTPSRYKTTEFSLEQFLPQADGAQATRSLDSVLTELMFRAQGALFPGQPIENLLESLLELVLAYMPASRAAVQLWSAEAGRLEGGLTVDRKSGSGAGKDFIMSSGVSEKVMRERKAVLIRDVAADLEFKSRKSLVGAGVSSAVAAPLFDGNDILGVLYADIKEGVQELGEADVAVVSVLAAMAGTSLVAAQMIAALMRSEASLREEATLLREQNLALRARLGEHDTLET